MKKMLLIVVGIIVLVLHAPSFAVDCGNVDGDVDGKVNLADITALIDHVYLSKDSLSNPLAANVDGDVYGKLNLADITRLIDFVYLTHNPLNCLSYSITKTTIIVPQDSSDIIIGYDTNGTIVFNETSVYAQSIAVGDVLIGQNDTQAPDGFLRRVTSKTAQGGSIVLGTEPATMMESFETMDISETHPLRPSDVKTSKLYRGSTFIPNKDDETFTVDLDCVFFDQDGDPGTTDDQIRLDGTYVFTADLFAKIKMKWFSLKKFEAGIVTNQNANLDLIATMQWQFNEEVEFDLAEFHFGAIPVGGVVWLVPTLTVEAHIHGDLTVTVETSIAYTQELRYGFGWADDQFYTISEGTKDFTYTPPELAAEFNFEPGASLNASCLLYGVAGPYMAGKTGLHFQSILNADPCAVDLTFDLDAILYAVVGIECDILNLDYNKQFELYTHPIGEWVYPLGGTGTISINPEPDAINASWTLDGPCGYSSGGTGDEILANLDPGNYTIIWGEVSGWTAPANLSQDLIAGQTLNFDGTYVENNTVPVLTTTAVSTITQTTAQCGGTITSDGGATVTALGVCWSTNPTPTVADSRTTDGTGTGSFNSSMTGLTAGTAYFVRAYATNSIETGYGNEVSFTTLPNETGTVTDIDGNVYQTIMIGSQVWMAENLKVTHYRNGDPITDGAEWGDLNTGAYCEYNNDIGNVATYGRLYNWYAVDDSRNIAPAGWHVATDEEWKQLEMYLGLSQAEADATGWRGTDEGGKLKEIGTTHWIDPNSGATNESGFSALPGGYRSSLGSFNNIGYNAHFWSSAEYSSGYAWHHFLQYDKSEIVRGSTNSFAGFSIRCVRDEISTPEVTTAAVSGITQSTAECGGTILSDGGATVTARGVCWSTNPTPTVADSRTTDGTGTGSFTSLVTGLTPNTTFYIRAYATNNSGTGYGNIESFATLELSSTVTDIDGNVYQTITIGSQVWMAENLKVTHYRNGDPIPHVTDIGIWDVLSTGAYCEYSNNPANVNTYGRLYNWYAVDDSRNIAPEGWHVPSDAEWQTFVDYLGGNEVAGGKMKETGTTHWTSPNEGATNESGFTALPGGRRWASGYFGGIGIYAYFWTSTKYLSNPAWDWLLHYDRSQIFHQYANKQDGNSVRCVRD